MHGGGQLQAQNGCGLAIKCVAHLAVAAGGCCAFAQQVFIVAEEESGFHAGFVFRKTHAELIVDGFFLLYAGGVAGCSKALVYTAEQGKLPAYLVDGTKAGQPDPGFVLPTVAEVSV